jgi:hypothetical protein
MEFMTKQQAEELAEHIRQNFPSVTVEEVFSSDEIEINRDKYPSWSHLIEVAIPIRGGGVYHPWITSNAHWEEVKGSQSLLVY